MEFTPTSFRLAVSKAARSADKDTLRRLLARLKVVAVAGVRESFNAGRSPSGEAWKPLAHPRPDGGNQPLRDKGLLAASVSALVTETELSLRASHPGANVHQFGAVLRPTRAKALTIPLTIEAKRTGSPGRGRFPRPLFVWRGHRSAFLAESDGEKLTLHYVLKDSVEVPAREFLGFSESTLRKMDRVIADTIADNVVTVFSVPASGARQV